MRLIPLLLRVLLCIALLANGVAGAQAAVRMAMPRADAHAGVQAPSPAAACHREAPASAGHAMPDGDCCKDVRCDGLCAPSAVQMPAPLAIAPPAARATPPADLRRDGHAPPPLPHALRPPIG